MKIAIMADIHSNHIALERCIAEAKYRDAEEFIFLVIILENWLILNVLWNFFRHLKRSILVPLFRGIKKTIG